MSRKGGSETLFFIGVCVVPILWAGLLVLGLALGDKMSNEIGLIYSLVLIVVGPTLFYLGLSQAWKK